MPTKPCSILPPRQGGAPLPPSSQSTKDKEAEKRKKFTPCPGPTPPSRWPLPSRGVLFSHLQPVPIISGHHDLRGWARRWCRNFLSMTRRWGRRPPPSSGLPDLFRCAFARASVVDAFGHVCARLAFARQARCDGAPVPVGAMIPAHKAQRAPQVHCASMWRYPLQWPRCGSDRASWKTSAW